MRSICKTGNRNFIKINKFVYFRTVKMEAIMLPDIDKIKGVHPGASIEAGDQKKRVKK